jgi:hypothetical protein
VLDKLKPFADAELVIRDTPAEFQPLHCGKHSATGYRAVLRAGACKLIGDDLVEFRWLAERNGEQTLALIRETLAAAPVTA